MRLKKRRETTRGLLILVLLIGGLQFLYLCSNLDKSFSADYHLRNRESDSAFRKHVFRRIVHLRQGAARSWNRVTLKAQIKNETTGSDDMEYTTRLDIVNNRFHTPPLRVSVKQFIPPVHDPLMYGFRRQSKGYLTIGIPSIRRPNTEFIYLYQTLDSLINNTSAEDKMKITIVVLLSDQNDTYNNEIALGVYSRFQIFCEEGFLRVIQAPKSMYPNFQKLKRTMIDKIERVQWRAKQNIDFAYLCLYSVNISDYYIQLEDDVLSAGNFLTYIRNQIDNITKPWFMLEFSRLGFIGKLFKDKDIFWVADFLLLNFDKVPGDLLLGKMLFVKGQKFPIHADYSLFQHNGKFSSLENKMMPSIDSKFKDADKLDLPMMSLPKGNNPPAKFFTSFEPVSGYFPSFAYDGNSSTFFWAKTPRRHDHFTIQFKNPQNFNRIIISTGDRRRKQDSLINGVLFIATTRTINARLKSTSNYKRLADFVDGEIDTKAMGISLPNEITCLKIKLLRTSKTWVIIRDIVLL